jgi:hypothetical protein
VIDGQLELVVDKRQAGDGVVCDVSYDSVPVSGNEATIVVTPSPQVQGIVPIIVETAQAPIVAY